VSGEHLKGFGFADGAEVPVRGNEPMHLFCVIDDHMFPFILESGKLGIKSSWSSYFQKLQASVTTEGV